MPKRILVTGASVAGSAVAALLGRQGHHVTLLERTDTFRDGGQNIDVRGVGREVLRRMGLENKALAKGTGEEGTVWVNADGSEAAKFLASELEGDGPTAEMEILRGDLARLLFDMAKDHAEVRFGDTIASIDDGASPARVSFASGLVEEFDAVIVAEGVGSATREIVFPQENDPRWMDLAIAYFTIPRSPDDDKMWRWYNAPGKRSVSLRPDQHGTTRAMLCVVKPADGEESWPVGQQKAMLHRIFKGAGWETERVLSHMDAAEDFYFDNLRQVRMPRWSKGRVCLTGDAAWCVTPLGGVGATLAVTGAYVLAQEIDRHESVTDAFSAYEEQMRPMVADGQGVPKIAPRLMHPKSRTGIRLLHFVLGVASLEPVRDLSAKLIGSPDKEVDLSRYG